MEGNSINDLIVLESFFILNNFKQVILLHNPPSDDVNLYDSSLHVNICINEGLPIFIYNILQLIHVIYISSILVNYYFLLQNLKVLVNHINYRSTVSYKHVSLVVSQAPTVFRPSLLLLAFESVSIEPINFSLSPCKKVNVVSLWEPSCPLQKDWFVDWSYWFETL